MTEIYDYNRERDYEKIMLLIRRENWQSYFEERKDEFVVALERSCTCVAYEGDVLIGFVRGITDGCFTLFIPEIIVHPDYRRAGCGRKLIAHLHGRFPKTRIDLISDNDMFYQSQGFRVIGNGMRLCDWY